MSAALGLFVSTTLLALGAVSAAWPIKTIDLSKDGANCDYTKEQYLQVETYDFHDHPKVTMKWTQTTGPCGEPLDNPKSWTATYDEGAGDKGPSDGRVQLNIFLCCPFGDYELELDIESYSDPGSLLQQRTAWEIENGTDQYHIWDTVNTYLKSDPDYSPVTPGEYKWPLESATGFYKNIYAGPLPPLECEDPIPAGYVSVGCYEDSSKNRLLSVGPTAYPDKGENGLTPSVCAKQCADYDYFGTEFGYECYCGTEEDMASAKGSAECGMLYSALCTGDSTVACGGKNAIHVYKKGETPVPTGPVYLGCYADKKDGRDMPDTGKYTNAAMTTEFCIDYCAERNYKYAGTQYGVECWCSSSYGSHGTSDECDYKCGGDAEQICGGYDALSVYKVALE